jgi:hypothetical protein
MLGIFRWNRESMLEIHCPFIPPVQVPFSSIVRRFSVHPLVVRIGIVCAEIFFGSLNYIKVRVFACVLFAVVVLIVGTAYQSFFHVSLVKFLVARQTSALKT